MKFIKLFKIKNNVMYLIPIMLVMITTTMFSVSTAKAAKFLEEYGRGVLVKVVDGDTLKLNVNGTIMNYRLAAIDTPETYNNRKAKKDIIKCGISKTVMFKLGKTSTKYVMNHYDVGDVVEYYKVGVGRYKRPIIWVYGITPNLVKSGMARVVYYRNVVPSKMRYLKELETEAKNNNIGFWSKLGCWK